MAMLRSKRSKKLNGESEATKKVKNESSSGKAETSAKMEEDINLDEFTYIQKGELNTKYGIKVYYKQTPDIVVSYAGIPDHVVFYTNDWSKRIADIPFIKHTVTTRRKREHNHWIAQYDDIIIWSGVVYRDQRDNAKYGKGQLNKKRIHAFILNKKTKAYIRFDDTVDVITGE